jgi:DNA-damage-inducible protein J
MNKAAMINARIEPKLKKQAESILSKVGLSSAEAIRLFYNQICLHKGIPFEIKIPNATTVAAMKAAQTRQTERVDDLDKLFDED